MKCDVEFGIFPFFMLQFELSRNCYLSFQNSVILVVLTLDGCSLKNWQYVDYDIQIHRILCFRPTEIGGYKHTSDGIARW